MKHRFDRERAYIFALMFVVSSSFILIGDDTVMVTGESLSLYGHVRADNNEIWALSGDENIEASAGLSFIGESMTGPGGRLGSYLWSGDLNGDGYDDIAMSAPHLEGALSVREGGLLYIFYGSKELQNGVVDIETAVPDIVIRGGAEDSKLLTSFAVGDIDNDGNFDLVLGIPSQPSCGRLYILWGDGNWSGEIDLFDPGKLNPNGDPYGFIRDDDHLILAGHIAPVPWPESDYKIGQSVVVSDLDGDSYDDVVFSAPGWNKVNIMWGGPNRFQLGDEMTIIQDDQNSGLFGQSVISLDMNGNQMPDLAISGPLRNHPTTLYQQTGTVMVIFDAGDLRGTVNINVEDTVRPFIYGNDPNDNFGRVILSKDINHDGRDDLIVGAPYSDGPDDTRYNSGSIHIYFGGQINQFPVIMDSETGADVIIYGATKEGPTYPGDRLGTVFELGDINSDGEHGLIIGYPDVSVQDAEKAGMVAYYTYQQVFSSPPRSIDLKDIDPTFRIFGIDMQDRLGYSLCIADMDGDGAHELIIGSPASDGIENTRPSCGEVHIIRGSKVGIDSLTLSGMGTQDGFVLCGKGDTTITVGYSHSEDNDLLLSMDVELQDLGIKMTIPLATGEYPIIDTPYEMIKPVSKVIVSKTTNGAQASAVIEFTWSFPSGEYDVKIIVSSSKWNYSRLFSKAILSEDVLIFLENYELFRNGQRTVHGSEWFGPDDRIDINGLSLYYDTVPPIEVIDGPFEISLLVNAISIHTQEYVPDMSLNFTITDEDSIILTVKASPIIGIFPTGIPSEFIPFISGQIVLELHIDQTPPDIPSNLVLDPGTFGHEDYGTEGEWEIRWDDGRTNGGDAGSGIWAYEVGIKEEVKIAMHPGGLLGTYYNDDRFIEEGLSIVDEQIDFNWGNYPPKPEIIPLGFSIRWHGWLMPDQNIKTRFTIWGKGGNSLLIFDDQRLLEWNDVEFRRSSGYVDLVGGEIYYIELYFRQKGDLENSLFLRWDDESGNSVEISSSSMYYPSNTSSIDIESSISEIFNVSVKAIDWVGSISGPAFSQGIIDLDQPVIDLTRYSSWYNSSRVEVHFALFDPTIMGMEGSGIDGDSISYRLMHETETEYSPPYKEEIWLKYGDSLSFVDVMMRLELDGTWKGSLQIFASDRVGNTVQSSSLSLGVDMIAPQFDMVQPSTFIIHNTADLSFALRVEDIQGSGVNGETIAYRTRMNDTDWSGWMDIGRETASEQLMIEFTHKLSEGTNFIQFMAEDIVGNMGISREYELRVKVPTVNNPPTPLISSPINGTSYSEGHPVILDASGSTDDGIGLFPELRFTWSSNRTGLLGTGKVISINILTTGWHRITLFVDDGSPGNNVSDHVDIYIRRAVNPNGTVNPEPNATDEAYRTILVISALAVVIIVIIVFIILFVKRYGNERGAEIRIDYKEETDDDIDYMIKSRYDEFDSEE
ncbi:MAG: PA14 domain-containing protein [Candidatus Thermoplasmatota archaeon]|nr:PA14 domain-containing protein [Candidatus Thermoplasmatota archaeon]